MNLSLEEQFRLENLALRTLVMCLLLRQIEKDNSEETAVRRLFEDSVQKFRLHGADESRSAVARDYMLQKGLEWISSAAHPGQSNQPQDK